MAGRPEKKIDKELFENLCGLMCTESEICGILKTTDKTLVKWIRKTYNMEFSEVIKIYSSNGKIALRRAQYKSAVEKGNVSMQIWLGKQWLGQKDNAIVQLTEAQDDPLSLAFEELHGEKL